MTALLLAIALVSGVGVPQVQLGDADEAERMEALFDRLLSEAFDAEGERDGR